MGKRKLPDDFLQHFVETLAPALVLDSQRKHSAHLKMQNISDQTLREFRFCRNSCYNIFEHRANSFPQQLVFSEEHASNKHLLEFFVLNDDGS